MKRILLYTTLACSVLLSSCESELDSKHNNPDGFTDANIEYLYSRGVIRTIENDYGDYWNFVFRLVGTYTQTVSREAGANRVNVYTVQSDNGRWENYYVKRMQELMEMEKIYNYTLPEAEKKNYTPFMETAKVLKAYNTALATDYFGAMPYTEAFTARNGIYGQPVNLKPKYDSQQEIYYAILADLESAANYLKTATLDSNNSLHRSFKNQDVIYYGDLKKWYQFANSLRLRYAMRISEVDPAKAKEVLSKLSMEDLITVNSDNAYTYSENTANTGIWRAIIESQDKDNGYAFAPELMTKLLKEASDPRLQVFFQPASNELGVVYDKTQEIVAYPSSASDALDIMNSTSAAERRKKYGVVNTVTFRNNYKLPYGVGITAADVYLLLAEAQHRGLVSWSSSAEDLYNKGVITSIQEYYNYYKNSSETNLKDADIAATDVSEATLKTWLTGSTFKFDPSKALEQIATQKWINFDILQPFEAWAEYRRTDLPVLISDMENGNVLNKENTPVRFLYPANESSMNAENFQTVADQNYTNKRLWWDVK